MDKKPLATQLRTLAENPHNRSVVCKDDAALGGMVIFLTDEDMDVVHIALEALNYLSELSTNRPIMRAKLGLMKSCEVIASKDNDYSLKSQIIAENILKRLALSTSSSVNSASNKDSMLFDEKENHAVHANQSTPVSVTRTRTSKTRFASEGQSTPSSSQSFFTGVNNKRARTIVLQVTGMDEREDKRAVTDALVKVKGVISFTFDMKASRVTVRSRADIPVERLCQGIESFSHKDMEVRHVTKNDRGEEVLKSMTTSKRDSPPSTTRPSSYEPDYLEEDEVDVDLKSAIVRTGKDTSSSDGGWFGSISNYVSRTLYW